MLDRDDLFGLLGYNYRRLKQEKVSQGALLGLLVCKSCTKRLTNLPGGIMKIKIVQLHSLALIAQTMLSKVVWD